MPSRRRIAIGAGITLVLTSVLVAGAWWWWIPAAVRERVAAAAARRGLEASVADVELGLTEVRLDGVRLTGGDGALVVRVARVDPHAGPFALASGGTGAIRELRLTDVRVSADLDDPRLEAALGALRGEGDAAEASARSGGRAIHVAGLAVALRDRDGTLLDVERGQARLSAEGTLRVSLGPLAIAPGEPDRVSIGGATARLERSESGWRIAAAALEEAEVRYLERESDARSPIWARLRRHADRIGRMAGLGDAHEAESSAATADVPPPEDDSPGDDSALPAIAADEAPAPRDAVSEEGEPAAAGTRSAPARLVRALEALHPRLTADAAITLEGLSVTAHEGDGERPVLRELEAEVRARPEGRYRLEGSGRPGRGGRLGWDLTVDPTALRAEGRVDFQRLPFVLLVPVLPRLPWYHPEDTRLSGELTIRGEAGGSSMHLAGEVAVEDLALSSPRIAPSPVRRIALFLSGEADWIPLDRRLEIERMQLGLGEARANLSGSLEWPEDHYRLDLRATLPPTDCNAAVGAIPADLLAEATAFTFTGRIGGQVVARVDSRDLDDTVLTIHVANGCHFETAPGMADVRRFEAPFTHRVVEPDGTTFEMETGPGTLSWTPLSEISPFLIQAVLGHEDGGFFRHGGFSPSSIRVALVRNLRAGRYVYGASTITMQLVKNVFLHREKTLARKVQEVLLTWWLESVMDKARILELYLNVIEYGPQVYGIRAAAQHYFGRSPAELGPAESAYLATILPNPKAYHSHWEEDALPERHRRRIARFLHALGNRERFDEAAVSYALERLEAFDFHHPDEPLPAPPTEPRGQAAPLPIEGRPDALDAAWEEALGPDDPAASAEEADGG